MPYYEHVFMVRQDVSAARVEALADRFKSVLSDNDAKVIKTEHWGIKPLAYKIGKNRKAHYTLFNIESVPSAIAEMERQMKMNEDVIRFMTLRVDEPELEPSAMMRAKTSRERGTVGRHAPRERQSRRGDKPVPAAHDETQSKESA